MPIPMHMRIYFRLWPIFSVKAAKSAVHRASPWIEHDVDIAELDDKTRCPDEFNFRVWHADDFNSALRLCRCGYCTVVTVIAF